MDAVLHNRAKQVAGDVLDHLHTKPTNFVVAVLWHDFQAGQPPERDSFMFVKANGKISVKKIREQYIIHGSNGLKNIALKTGDKDTPDEAKLVQLDYFRDRIVVFAAEVSATKAVVDKSTEANIESRGVNGLREANNLLETNNNLRGPDELRESIDVHQPDNLRQPDYLRQSSNLREADNFGETDKNLRRPDDLRESDNLRQSDYLRRAEDLRESNHLRRADDLRESNHLRDSVHFREADDLREPSYLTNHLREPNHFRKVDNLRETDKIRDLNSSPRPTSTRVSSTTPTAMGSNEHRRNTAQLNGEASIMPPTSRPGLDASADASARHARPTGEASASSPYARPVFSTPALPPTSSSAAASRRNVARSTQSPQTGSPHTSNASPMIPHQPAVQNSRQYANSAGPFGSASPSARPKYDPSDHQPSYEHIRDPRPYSYSYATPSRQNNVKSEKGMGSVLGHGPGLGPRPQPDVKAEIEQEAQLPQPLPAQPFIKPDAVNHQSTTSNWLPEDGDDLEQQATSSVYLQQLAMENDTNKLEAGVDQGVKLLDRLLATLQPGAHTDDVQQWTKQIDLVRQDASRSRTVVGVVGNTGAGKSSVINAILDEERLVPTNCMRACTAVVTEISYNYSDEDSDKYRAEIEFIKPEDWEKELRVLFDEVLDSSGNISKEVYNQDSEAGIAYAKMRAVYWKLTKEDLAASSVEELMHDISVRNLLGATKNVKSRYCDSFYKSLQHYVDSKEKADSTGNSKDSEEEKKKRKREQEFWPLIKVVRIYVKADALSTGAVLVDLPGVADSNAARAAVAEGYMKQCTGLWIVSPINRAVDDKAAKNLLGATFRRQLKYDGTYSAVTFICSKVDDISNTEAAESLPGLGGEVAGLDDQSRQLERRLKEAKRQISQRKDQKMAFRQTMDECDDALEKWEDLREKVEEGETVYAPASKSKKRKRASGSSDSEDDSNDEELYSQELSQSQSSVDRGLPLTSEDIETKIHELRDKKKEARRERNEIEAQIKEGNSRVKETNAEADVVEAKISQLCIAARNTYSKKAIQVDFAAGIKELDQETAAEENPDDFNPEDDMRDYEEVASSLPVFCVSSRAYQKLSNRFQKDHAVKGFTEVAQTEIPALQDHCKKLTEGVRAVGFRRFLNALSQLRNSLSLWTNNDGTGINMTDQQKDIEKRLLTRKLKDLEKVLESSVKNTLVEMKDALNDNIFENYGTALRHASEAALPTSQRWGAHKNDGGLYWATYKATVRRGGVYAGASGPQDFNAQLAEPIYKHLASGWEKAFQRRLPHVLKSCAKSFSDHLRAFHKAIESHSRGTGGNPRLGLLAQQLTAYENVFKDLASKMVDMINESQREINREFTPSVCNAMIPAYTICTAESGTGSFKRMKQHMADHVTTQKDVMFQSATEIVRQKLNTMCKAVEEQMADRTDAVFVGMRRDYLQVLSNVRVDEAEMMPKWERTMRSRVEDVIKNSEDVFQAVFEGRTVNEEAAVPGAQSGFAIKGEETGDGEENDNAEAPGNAEGGKNDTLVKSEDASESGSKDVAMTDANGDD